MARKMVHINNSSHGFSTYEWYFVGDDNNAVIFDSIFNQQLKENLAPL